MYVRMTTTHGSNEDMVGLAAISGETMETWLRELEGFAGCSCSASRDRHDAGAHVLGEPRGGGEPPGRRTRLREKITETVSVEVQETEAYDLAFADLPALRSS